jgi:hypothetical protein
VEVIVEFAFVDQLRMIGVDRLYFDGHFKIGFGVDSLEDLSKGSLINLSDDLEVFSHFLKHLRHSFSVIK